MTAMTTIGPGGLDPVGMRPDPGTGAGMAAGAHPPGAARSLSIGTGRRTTWALSGSADTAKVRRLFQVVP